MVLLGEVSPYAAMPTAVGIRRYPLSGAPAPQHPIHSSNIPPYFGHKTFCHFKQRPEGYLL